MRTLQYTRCTGLLHAHVCAEQVQLREEGATLELWWSYGAHMVMVNRQPSLCSPGAPIRKCNITTTNKQQQTQATHNTVKTRGSGQAGLALRDLGHAAAGRAVVKQWERVGGASAVGKPGSSSGGSRGV